MDEQIDQAIGPQGGKSSLEALIYARRWSKLLGPPALVTAGLSVITLGATALLFRQLPESDAGILALVLAYVEILSLLGLLGQSTVITRRYSRLDPQGFAWKHDLSIIARMALPIVILGVMVAGAVYKFDLIKLAYVGFAGALLVPTLALIRMLNAHGRYVWSSLLLRLPNTLLALPALLFLLAPSLIGLNAVLVLHIVAIFGVGLMSLWLVRTSIKLGPVNITSAERRQGLYFLATQASLLVSFQGVIAIAGALLSPGRLAVYAAIAILFRAFKLVTSILWMVIPPEIIREKRPSYARLFGGTVMIAAIGGVLTLLLGPKIIQSIYGGKYDEGTFLIFWMAVAGMLLVAEVLPRSHIIGKLEWANLRPFILVQITVMASVLPAGIWLVFHYHLLGIALASIFTLLVRNTLAYSYFVKLLIRAPTSKSRISS
ncbi:MAG: lipopolysaccharide biosynthesis protein [Anaerolineales bacterium]